MQNFMEGIDMKDVVYIKMKKYVSAHPNELITLENICDIITSREEEKKLLETPIYQIRKKDLNLVVIDFFIIVKHLKNRFQDKQFQLIGSPHTIIKVNEQQQKKPNILVFLVWILLFIGTAMTIMNFHYDVNMQEVQQKLHYFITGEENEFPLFIQIPYSLGLGLGMLLFFNHWFKKRLTDEPSPLEIELHSYQKSIDEFTVENEQVLKEE